MKKSVLLFLVFLSQFIFSQTRDHGFFGGLSGGLAVPNNRLGLYYDFEAGYFAGKNHFFAKFDHVNSKSWKTEAVAIILPIPIASLKVHTNEISVLYGYSILNDRWKIVPSAGIGMQLIRTSYVNNEEETLNYKESRNGVFVPLEFSFIKTFENKSALLLKIVGGVGKSSYAGITIGYGFGH